MKSSSLLFVSGLTLLVTAPAHSAEITELVINTYNYVGPSGNPIIVSNVFTSPSFTFLAGTHYSNDFFLYAEGAPPAGFVGTADFEAPNGANLEPMTYSGASRWPFNPAGTPGFDYGIYSSGEDAFNGQFTVLEAVYDSSDTMQHFGATFVATSPTTGVVIATGTAYYNFDASVSSVPEPGSLALAALSLLPACYSLRRNRKEWWAL